MNNEFKEITKEEAIKAIHRYILGDNPDDREYLETFEECMAVFDDGYMFFQGSLWDRDPDYKYTDIRMKKYNEHFNEVHNQFIDYFKNEHGLDNLIYLVIDGMTVSVFYNGSDFKSNVTDSNSAFDFAYDLVKRLGVQDNEIYGKFIEERF